jgi:hypothetical protein
MKNIITLNESDIARIVKRVISENQKVLLVSSNNGSVAPSPFRTYEWDTITNQANKMRNKSKLFA